MFREAPERFVAARDALVKQLREQDRQQDAVLVKSLRKPTVVTWTLNQLAVRDTGGVRALLDAGAQVRSVQQAALSSSKGASERLREATSSRRAAVTRLINVAREILADVGKVSISDTHVQAIERALETASIDHEAGKHLLEGTFETPPQDSPGFGDVSGLFAVPDLPPATEHPAEPDRSRPEEQGEGNACGRPVAVIGSAPSPGQGRRGPEGPQGPGCGGPLRHRAGGDAEAPGCGGGEAPCCRGRSSRVGVGGRARGTRRGRSRLGPGLIR